MSENESPFGEVIYAYTRAQAIADGVLHDVTTTAKEAGIVLPTVVTDSVWGRCVSVPESLRGQQDEEGRLWDVVYMASHYLREAKRSGVHSDQLTYEVLVRDGDGLTRLVSIIAHVGPGDEGEPVLTLMFPEDN